MAYEWKSQTKHNLSSWCDAMPWQGNHYCCCCCCSWRWWWRISYLAIVELSRVRQHNRRTNECAHERESKAKKNSHYIILLWILNFIFLFILPQWEEGASTSDQKHVEWEIEAKNATSPSYTHTHFLNWRFFERYACSYSPKVSIWNFLFGKLSLLEALSAASITRTHKNPIGSQRNGKADEKMKTKKRKQSKKSNCVATS